MACVAHLLLLGTAWRDVTRFKAADRAAMSHFTTDVRSMAMLDCRRQVRVSLVTE